MAHGFSFWVLNLAEWNRPVLMAIKGAVSDENLDKTVITEQQVLFGCGVRGRCLRWSAVSVIVSTRCYCIHTHALFARQVWKSKYLSIKIQTGSVWVHNYLLKKEKAHTHSLHISLITSRMEIWHGCTSKTRANKKRCKDIILAFWPQGYTFWPLNTTLNLL